MIKSSINITSTTQLVIDQEDDDRNDDSSNTMYIWEKKSEFTAFTDEEFNLNSAIQNDREKLKKAKLRRTAPAIRRGLIRFLFVALDCSSSSNERDFRPSRIQVCKNNIKTFIFDYFDQNPISQLGDYNCLCSVLIITALSLSIDRSVCIYISRHSSLLLFVRFVSDEKSFG